ncbi:MAG: GTP-binding protein [Proteobacteria bacterium]|nr:GTP-binding protein [Pseudomonadota bacterium]
MTTAPSPSSAPIPVFVLTGFLGAGKTTLLAGLLRHPGMANTAVIVNELGEIGLDHFLVESREGDVVLLNAGCLCCAILNTLPETLADLHFRRVRGDIPAFERVVVETTGLADPGPIVHALATSALIAGRFRLEGVIATVDGVLGLGEIERHPEVVRQIAIADRLVLTKTDIADGPTVSRLRARLAALNPGAPVIEIANGTVADGAALVRPGSFRVPDDPGEVGRWLAGERHDHPHGPGGDRPHGAEGHHHDARVRALSAWLDGPVAWEGYAAWVEELRRIEGPRLLRMKGLLNVAGSDRPYAVHAVQHVFFRPVRLARWPDADRRSRIVLITYDLDPARARATLAALGAPVEKAVLEG